ncbi:glycosyltransferase [Wenzhouxiangella sediminis]|uniref:Glycosyl transferase n=1 Tax=Wenzhouxiangella sediminis TaxID=1792836 RepID=A0A3E1K5K5_9GAMM|nr:glycosyltransferase [Wenzhouxiangella sediminis]RFF29295.1 glycosyl transferase [Wenzhouxiangella sediminis]
MSIPRVFHFVFGLREQREPFHLLHYLCLASCLAVNRPEAVVFHYRHEPFGPWWDRIRPRLELRKIDVIPEGFDPGRYDDSQEGRMIRRLGIDYAHESDFLRMDILLSEGGIYADMDTLFVRAYPDEWLAGRFVIGEEYAPLQPGEPLRPSLCNAVMMARAGDPFARAWRERMAAAFDGRWDSHSCREAGRLWQSHSDWLRVLPSAYFYRYGSTPEGLATLLEDSDGDRPDLYSIHLWAHLWWDAARRDMSDVHAGMIDEGWILKGKSTLARLARPFLEEGA